MFGLFNKSSKGIEVVDKVWLSNKAKWNACIQMVKANPAVLLVAWFDETLQEIQGYAELKENSIQAKDLTVDKRVERMIVFAEHYPLSAIEQALFAKLNLREVPVLSSIEEPFFMQFGGERMAEVMKRLASEDEIIGHSIVTKAIRNAQEKIAKKSGTDYPTPSPQEWFKLNLKET